MIFGDRVAEMVAAVTKPKKHDPRFKTKQEAHDWYYANLRKSSSAAKLVKLCDRLHNMRTLDACSVEKQKRKIQETRELIYPLIGDIEGEYPEQAKILFTELEIALSKIEETHKPAH